MQKQVDNSHYRFNNYISLQRWNSFWHQLSIINSKDVSSLLEIGNGGGVLKNNLPTYKSIHITTCDIADDLKPDVIADVRSLPFKDNEFDSSCAFQVLEHIPIDDFEKAVSEMARVSKKYVFISLPHYGPNFKLHLKLPFLPDVKLHYKIPFLKKHVWDTGNHHYFEIGKKGTSISQIREKIGKYLIIEKDYIAFENNYHHFFICKKYE